MSERRGAGRKSAAGCDLEFATPLRAVKEAQGHHLAQRIDERGQPPAVSAAQGTATALEGSVGDGHIARGE